MGVYTSKTLMNRIVSKFLIYLIGALGAVGGYLIVDFFSDSNVLLISGGFIGLILGLGVALWISTKVLVGTIK